MEDILQHLPLSAILIYLQPELIFMEFTIGLQEHMSNL
jgi:hypothetical protein